MNPFEFANAINYTKKNIMVDDITEKVEGDLMPMIQDTVKKIPRIR